MTWDVTDLYVSVPRDTVILVSLGQILAHLPDPCSDDARVLTRMFQQSGMAYITTVEGVLSDLVTAYQPITRETVAAFTDNSLYRFAAVLIPGGISKVQSEDYPHRIGWWHITGDRYIEDPNPGG